MRPFRPPKSDMNPLERRTTLTLSLIQALRMLGMFMILPVFALYARDLPGGATAAQVGWAIGLYGLVQAVLQIPFGLASDRIGRKPVIVGGLLLFALGSWIAGASHDIGLIMLGRALQGAGAVSGAVSALLADATRVQVRTAAMAIMGIGMGGAFLLALVLGPVFAGWIGVDGIFHMTAVAAVIAAAAVIWALPAVPLQPAAPGGLRRVLADSTLLRFDAGIFLLHTMMTALFIAAPHAIEDTLHMPASAHWEVYLPIMLVSVLLVFPAIRVIEKRGQGARAFVASIAIVGAALVLAALGWHHAIWLFAALVLFFIGFNYLEGALPSLISRHAPPSEKGAALGIYSSSQFLGGFAGAKLGAAAFGHYGAGGTFAVAALVSVVWLAFALAGASAARGSESGETPAV